MIKKGLVFWIAVCCVVSGCYGWTPNTWHSPSSTIPYRHSTLSQAHTKERLENTNTHYLPGDRLPLFVVETLRGKVEFSNASMPFSSLQIHCTMEKNAFSKAMWENDEYVDDLLLSAPEGCGFLFMSYEDTAYELAEYRRQKLIDRMQALQFNSDRQRRWLDRSFFAVNPVSKQSSVLPTLLSSPGWQSYATQARYTIDDDSHMITIARLDGRWPEFLSVEQVLPKGSNYALFDAGDACSPLVGVDGVNQLALISRAGNCSFARKLEHAAKTGAVAAVIYTTEKEPLVDIDCEFCLSLPNITGTMISYVEGIRIKDLLSNGHLVKMNFHSSSEPGIDMVIDYDFRAQEIGFIMYPSMEFFGWTAQYYRYQAGQSEYLSSIKDRTHLVHIFDHDLLNISVSRQVTMPNNKTIDLAKSLYFHLELRCASAFDASCPSWDRTITLKAQCGDASHPSFEVAHWINPFGRGIGNWLTDVSSLAPLFYNKGKCTFSMSGTMKNEDWYPTLHLLLVNERIEISSLPLSQNQLETLVGQKEEDGNEFTEEESELLVAYRSQVERKETQVFSTMLLFTGGHLNASYNEQHKPVFFRVPNGTVSVELYSIMDGHGGNDHNCAEFCTTTHNFTFNGHVNIRDYKDAGSAAGCAQKTIIGVVPNEYGTWLYGRDGWCDGLEVIPWRVDITDQLKLDSKKENVAEYSALVVGKEPTGNEGNWNMAAYLAFSREIL